MLIKKVSFKFKRISYIEQPDVKTLLVPVLKKVKALDLLKPDFKYNEYFGKICTGIVNYKNSGFLSTQERKSLVLEGYVYTFSEKMVSKFLITSKDRLGLEKYLGQVLSNILKKLLGKEMTKFNNRKYNDIDHIRYEDMDLLEKFPSKNFKDELEDVMDFNTLVKEVNSYIDRKYFKTPESKIIVKDVFNGLINGKKLDTIGKKYDFTKRQMYRYLDMLKEIMVDYSKSSKNKDLQYVIENLSKNKKSIPEDFFSELFSEIKKTFLNGKKQAKTIRVRKVYNNLTEEYLINNTLSSETSSLDLKNSMEDYLSNFDDLTDAVDEGDATYCIKSV